MGVRESKLVGWFFLIVGVFVLLFSLHAAIFSVASPVTNSAVRNALVQAMMALFGDRNGLLAFHLLWAAVGAVFTGVSWKMLR